MLTDGKQIAAARQLLNWSQADLAKNAGISKPSVIRIEKDLHSVKDEIQHSIVQAMDMHGIEFTPKGVQERTYKIRNYYGSQGFREFMWDVYNTSNEIGGPIRLYNAKPSNWHTWLGAEWYSEHAARMESIKDKITWHAISKEGDDLFIAGGFGEYRWIPQDMFIDKSFYAYGNKLGFLNFEENALNIIVLENQDFADAFRNLFEIAWDSQTIIRAEEKTL